jgi:hypothetical protein
MLLCPSMGLWQRPPLFSLTCSNVNIVYVCVSDITHPSAIGNRTVTVCVYSQMHEMQRDLALNPSTMR